MPAARPIVLMSVTCAAPLRPCTASAKIPFERVRPLEQALVAVDLKTSACRRNTERMAGIGEPVGEFGNVVGALHEGRVNVVPHQNAPKRGCPVCHGLGEADHVGDDAVALGGEGVAKAAEARNHFVQDEEDAVGAGDFLQTLEIALRAREHAG
jgi:hypothetical protein